MLFLFMAINFADKAVLGQTALPIMRDLGLTHAQFGLLGASFYALFGVGGVFGGMMLLWSLCQLPVAIAASVTVLLASRIALGFAEGPAYPIALFAAYERFPDRRRAVPTAVIGSGALAGLGLLAPAVVIGVAGESWRVAFLILAALGLAWCIAWFALPERLGAATERGTVTPSRRSPRQHGLLADPTIIGVTLCGFAASWLLALAVVWLPAYLREAFGFAPAAAGRIVAATAVAQVAMLVGICWLSQRLGLRGLSSRFARGWLSALTLAASGVLTIALAQSHGTWMPALLAVGAFSIGTVIHALGPVLVAEITPHERRGSMLGIVNAIATLAGPLAPATMGLFVDVSSNVGAGYRQGFVVTGALVIAAAMAGLLLIDPGRGTRR